MIDASSSIAKALKFLHEEGYGEGYCFVYVTKQRGMFRRNLHKVGGAKNIQTLQPRLRASLSWNPTPPDVIAIYAIVMTEDDEAKDERHPYRLYEKNAQLSLCEFQIKGDCGREMYSVDSRECLGKIDESRTGGWLVYSTVKVPSLIEKFSLLPEEDQAVLVEKEICSILLEIEHRIARNRKESYAKDMFDKWRLLKRLKEMRKNHTQMFPLSIVSLIWSDQKREAVPHLEHLTDITSLSGNSVSESLSEARKFNSLDAAHERIVERASFELERCCGDHTKFSLHDVKNKSWDGYTSWTMRSLRLWSVQVTMFSTPLAFRLLWYKWSKLPEAEQRQRWVA